MESQEQKRDYQEQKRDYEQESNQRGIDASEMMSDFVNKSREYKAFTDNFLRQHRTLQQSMIRLMLEVIEKVASDEYRFDARNQGAHETCKRLIAGHKTEVYKLLLSQGETENGAKNYSEGEYCMPSKYLGTI